MISFLLDAGRPSRHSFWEWGGFPGQTLLVLSPPHRVFRTLGRLHSVMVPGLSYSKRKAFGETANIRDPSLIWGELASPSSPGRPLWRPPPRRAGVSG